MSDDPVPLSALEHWSYCPRQCALIHVEQAFDDNVFTMRGHALHARVDDPGFHHRDSVRVERALPVWSERLGLIGKCDVVEFDASGSPFPVEYKHGPKRVHAHDDVQLAAQAICLAEMTGKPVLRGAIYHYSSRRRREVDITPALVAQVEAMAEEVRQIRLSGTLPPPVNDRRCHACSLKERCQPELLANQSGLARARAALFEIGPLA